VSRQGRGVALEACRAGSAHVLVLGRVELVVLAWTAAKAGPPAECIGVCRASYTSLGLIHRIKDGILVGATFDTLNIVLSILIMSQAHRFASGCDAARVLSTSTDL